MGKHCNAPMPPAYDLIIERGGSIVVETIEALMAVVCRDENDHESTRT